MVTPDQVVETNWFGWIVASAFLTIVVSIAFGCLYALYLYTEIDSIKLALFILIVSVAASLWQLACSYNKYPPAQQQRIITTPSVVRWDWSEATTYNTYQISPDGIKSPSDGGLPTLEEEEEQPKKRGRRSVKEACLLVKFTIAVIRVFYGKGEKRIALIQKTAIEYHGEEGKRPTYNHESLGYIYERDSNKLRYPYIIPHTVVEPGNAIMESMKEYNEQPSFITIREDREFSTGHRVVKQTKIKRTFSLA